jgi:hypothetical protein
MGCLAVECWPSFKKKGKHMLNILNVFEEKEMCAKQETIAQCHTKFEKVCKQCAKLVRQPSPQS